MIQFVLDDVDEGSVVDVIAVHLHNLPFLVSLNALLDLQYQGHFSLNSHSKLKKFAKLKPIFPLNSTFWKVLIRSRPKLFRKLREVKVFSAFCNKILNFIFHLN